MAKRIPPVSSRRVALEGLPIVSYTVGDWCNNQDGSGPPEAVALSLKVEFSPGVVADLVFRLKTPRAVDNLIQSLLRHKRSTWPESQ